MRTSVQLPVHLKRVSWAKGASRESAPGWAALLPRRQGPAGTNARLRDPSGPRPRTDSAPACLPDSQGRQPAPPDPARSLLPSRVSAAHSPQLRGLLAPQATSGFASPGHGARDRRRRPGAPARAYSCGPTGPRQPGRASQAAVPCAGRAHPAGGAKGTRHRSDQSQVARMLVLRAFAE